MAWQRIIWLIVLGALTAALARTLVNQQLANVEADLAQQDAENHRQAQAYFDAKFGDQHAVSVHAQHASAAGARDWLTGP